MTVREAAAELGVSVALVYKLCEGRRLPHERHGLGRGRIVISPADLLAYRLSCRVEAEPEPGGASQASIPRRPYDWRARLAERRSRA